MTSGKKNLMPTAQQRRRASLATGHKPKNNLPKLSGPARIKYPPFIPVRLTRSVGQRQLEAVRDSKAESKALEKKKATSRKARPAVKPSTPPPPEKKASTTNSRKGATKRKATVQRVSTPSPTPQSQQTTPRSSTPNAKKRLRSDFGGFPDCVHGMSNLGNTCYMNSILQSLISIPSLTHDIRQLCNNSNNRLKKHSFSLGMLTLTHSFCNGGPYYMLQVKQAMGKRQACYLSNRQQDAHEFLLSCLSAIEDELHWLAVPSPSNRVSVRVSWQQVRCPVMRNLYCELQHNFKCGKCSENGNVKELYRDMSLTLPDKKRGKQPELTLTQLFESFFEEVDVERRCEKCNHNFSKGQRRMLVLPRVLVVCLKRFEHRSRYSYQTRKLTQPVKLSATVDMGGFCEDSFKTAQPFVQFDQEAQARNEATIRVKDQSNPTPPSSPLPIPIDSPPSAVKPVPKRLKKSTSTSPTNLAPPATRTPTRTPTTATDSLPSTPTAPPQTPPPQTPPPQTPPTVPPDTPQDDKGPPRETESLESESLKSGDLLRECLGKLDSEASGSQSLSLSLSLSQSQQSQSEPPSQSRGDEPSVTDEIDSDEELTLGQLEQRNEVKAVGLLGGGLLGGTVDRVPVTPPRDGKSDSPMDPTLRRALAASKRQFRNEEEKRRAEQEEMVKKELEEEGDESDDSGPPVVHENLYYDASSLVNKNTSSVYQLHAIVHHIGES